MSRLFLLILTIASGSLAGAGVIVALAMGYYDLRAILIGAGGGALLSLPVSWLVARQLENMTPPSTDETGDAG